MALQFSAVFLCPSALAAALFSSTLSPAARNAADARSAMGTSLLLAVSLLASYDAPLQMQGPR